MATMVGMTVWAVAFGVAFTAALLLVPTVFLSCSEEEESAYVFGLANEVDIRNSDEIAIMTYVQTRFDMENFTVWAIDNAEAEEEARQIFQKRLSAIQDDTLNAMLHEEDTYSLIMVSTLLRPDKDIEIARKTWPTNR